MEARFKRGATARVIYGAIVIVLWAIPMVWPAGSDRCVGALHAMQQDDGQAPPPETTLPADEWCQRAADRMHRKAHACTCHQHDCTKDLGDPNNRSGHTDPHCTAYCKVTQCRCDRGDCP